MSEKPQTQEPVTMQTPPQPPQTAAQAGEEYRAVQAILCVRSMCPRNPPTNDEIRSLRNHNRDPVLPLWLDMLIQGYRAEMRPVWCNAGQVVPTSQVRYDDLRILYVKYHPSHGPVYNRNFV
ncbi:hypothetical protein WG66_010669 [Moniliophthora roreri]|nr:hypothetical protein WG66_010669 [Moniliophthora roreri]